MTDSYPCGTPAAYRAHKRRGERACSECLRAWRVKARERATAARNTRLAAARLKPTAFFAPDPDGDA